MEKVITHAGLDVHLEGIVVAAIKGQVCESTIIDIPNDPKVIRRTFKRLAAEAYELRCCYEAGPCGFEVYRQLTAKVIRSRRTSPR